MLNKRSEGLRLPGAGNFSLYLLIITAIIASLTLFGCSGGSGSGGGQRPTTYVNPVARYAAGMVFKHKGYYYNYTLGGSPKGNWSFDAWYSNDLVTWTKAGKAFEKNKQTHMPFGDLDFWAPAVVYHNGKYYMTYAARVDKGPEAGYQSICLAVSDSPGKPFINVKAPLLRESKKDCLDGFIFKDDDGKIYLFYARGWKNNDVYHERIDRTYRTSQIWVREMSDDLMSVGEPHFVTQPEDDWEFESARSGDVWNESGTVWNEACNIFKRNGIYYVTYSANWVGGSEYAIGYAVADHPLGPWTKGKNNPLISSDFSKKISGPGHSSITTSPDGSEWFILYHSSDPDNPDKGREYNVDRIRFEEDGSIVVEGPTRTPQPMPSK